MVLNPDVVFPESDNLFWGIHKEEVLKVVSQNPVIYSSATWQIVEVVIEDSLFQKAFAFDDEDGTLYWIDLELMRSRDFYDDEPTEEAELEAAKAEYEQAYLKAVDDYTRKLGEPIFSGSEDEPGYPFTELAWKVAMWEVAANRFFVELDKPELDPYFVLKIASRSVND
jgi:hypothetical protein